MIVLLPYRSDAVARAFPWATVSLIAVNLALFACLGAPGTPGDGARVVDQLALRWGRFEPWTWIPAAFVHTGWLHVAVNMLFLWSFGFVVEGMLGARRFVALYLVLAAAWGGVAQVLMLGAEGGGAAGASGVIYGLMAIAALWSPRSTLSVLLWLFLVILRRVEMSLLGFCVLWIGLDLGIAVLTGFAMSTALLHLLGAGVGLAAGHGMLRAGLVDTEGWDWFSLRDRPPGPRAGDYVEGLGPRAAPPAPAARPLPGPTPAARTRGPQSLLDEARALLGRGRPDAVLDVLALLDAVPLSDAQRADHRCLRDAAYAMRAQDDPERA